MVTLWLYSLTAPLRVQSGELLAFSFFLVSGNHTYSSMQGRYRLSQPPRDQGLDWGKESRRPVSHPSSSQGRNTPVSHSSLLPACLMGERPYPDPPRQWILFPLLLSPGTGKKLTVKEKQTMQCTVGKTFSWFWPQELNGLHEKHWRQWWKNIYNREKTSGQGRCSESNKNFPQSFIWITNYLCLTCFPFFLFFN